MKTYAVFFTGDERKSALCIVGNRFPKVRLTAPKSCREDEWMFSRN